LLLYYITDRTQLAGDEAARRRRLLETIAEAVRHGVHYIQLREKDLCAREFENLAREAAALLDELKTENKELKTTLLINSRTDIALACGANGVHLRSDDISPADVRTIWTQCGGGTLARVSVGVSCHSYANVAEAARRGADLVVFGPVFEKRIDKDSMTAQPAGLEALRQACREKIPVFALGGITLDNAESCIQAGAAGIAAIRLFQEGNGAKAVQALAGRDSSKTG